MYDTSAYEFARQVHLTLDAIETSGEEEEEQCIE